MYFLYRAVNNSKVIKGQIEANSVLEVTNYLKSNNYFPIEIKEKKITENPFDSIFNKISFSDIVNLTRQLAIMLNAGLTLIDVFDILKKQNIKPALYKVIDTIDKEIKGGKQMSEALAIYPQYFPSLYIALVKSGEASGKLSQILLKLSDNLESQREFQSKIKGALVYPLIIIVGMVIVMFIMVTFVIPKLMELYKDFNVELPMPTKILLAVSTFAARFWPIIILAVFVFITAFRSYIKTIKGKYQYDKLMLRLPVIGNVVRMSNLVDSTRTLSILIGSGVSMLESLNIIVETSSNIIFRNAFNSIYSQVERGTALGDAMNNEGVFPPILIQMTTVGEQTGKLDDTLSRISNYFEMESTTAVKTMTTLIEPLILVFLGLGVGFLVMAVITPIYNLTNSF